ncbi:DUF397 domain-containing protein [Catenuloplanes japonicus]|uniref:DUF397 domain-containing protein n=1 Tax=Catenuloplanes japonicus TaxID=33876 RepID=UPI000527A7C8|nr:DUF397 domain-containing protein [Catenuloplanes japonicus]
MSDDIFSGHRSINLPDAFAGTANADWRRSTRCGSNACVEIAKVGKSYLVRDSKDLGQAPLRFSPRVWRAFVAGLSTGELNS